MATPLLDALFPQVCHLCRCHSGRPEALCWPCQDALLPNDSACLRCGLSLPPAIMGSHCGRCLIHPPPFNAVIAPWLYEEHMSYLVTQWKFHRHYRLTPLLASLWLQRVAQPPAVDLLLPVPLHWRRLLQRGYNQAALLAAELQRQCAALREVPLARNALRRVQATQAQSGLGARERHLNLTTAFTARRRFDGMRVAVVDDVMTTGATAEAIAHALRDAGAGEVQVWCVARTPAPPVYMQ